MTTVYVFDPTAWKAPVPEGIPAWLRPWRDCPCGSEEHQAGGHPLDQIDMESFYREHSETERRFSLVVKRWERKHRSRS